MSKGSKQRPTDQSKFNKNYNEIDWKKHHKEIPVLTENQKDILLREVKVAFKKDEDNN